MSCLAGFGNELVLGLAGNCGTADVIVGAAAEVELAPQGKLSCQPM